jgi:hypothetical protein
MSFSHFIGFFSRFCAFSQSFFIPPSSPNCFFMEEEKHPSKGVWFTPEESDHLLEHLSVLNDRLSQHSLHHAHFPSYSLYHAHFPSCLTLHIVVPSYKHGVGLDAASISKKCTTAEERLEESVQVQKSLNQSVKPIRGVFQYAKLSSLGVPSIRRGELF